jgi:hypothetical protein
MSAKAIASIVTGTGAFTQLSATSEGEKRLTISLPLAHVMTTTTNNTIETTLIAGIYIINDDPANLYFKSTSGASAVHAFQQN